MKGQMTEAHKQKMRAGRENAARLRHEAKSAPEPAGGVTALLELQLVELRAIRVAVERMAPGLGQPGLLGMPGPLPAIVRSGAGDDRTAFEQLQAEARRQAEIERRRAEAQAAFDAAKARLRDLDTNSTGVLTTMTRVASGDSNGHLDPVAEMTEELADLDDGPAQQPLPPPPSPLRLWGPRLDLYQRGKMWLPEWGPRPGQAGCAAPERLLEERGIGGLSGIA